MSFPTVAIIGAGFSGLASAIKLKKKLGVTAEVFETSNDIGGTWKHSTYPGCASDIQSHLYSLSFEPNPNWSQKFSPQKEILEYMHRVANKYDVLPQIQFETSVVSATWLEDKKKWQLELSRVSEEKHQIKHFDFIFSGIGSLRVPHIPKEFESFEGKIIHSALWDQDYDLNNKRVAVIGSGSSSIQIIPSIVPIVDCLYSFQRTATWVRPKDQYTYSDFIINVFTYVPLVMLMYRAYIFFSLERNFNQWGDKNSKRAKRATATVTKQMKEILLSNGRPDLIEKLIPDFAVGCKRIGYSDDYLQSLCLPNVTVNFSAIKKIEGRTISTADGQETEIDALILATGYDVAGFLGKMRVYGRDGVFLNDLWEEQIPKTYKTVTIHGFPNFFMLLGPGSILGHSSVVTMIESQVDFGIELIRHMTNNQIQSMDPTEKAQETFSSDLQEKLKGTVWTTGCKSWYMNKRGDIQALWPQTVMKFINMFKNTNFESDFIKV
ncbi:putative flavoprotein [Helicostylum pulchrum]|nr:putative flavoprotein [Helicostylum pulchrum]